MEYIYIFATLFYLILGFGVWNMWRALIDEDKAILIILLWPVVLLVMVFIIPEN